MKLMGVSLATMSILFCCVLFVVRTPYAETRQGPSRPAGLARRVQPARAHASPAQTTQTLQFMVAPEYPVGLNPWAAAVGDFNGDGKADLATSNSNGFTVSILLGNGDGTFQPKVDYPIGQFARSLVVGDFNGDQKPDLAVSSFSDNIVSILIGKGDGTFMSRVDYPTGAGSDSLAVGDFNHDGKPDLASANQTAGTVSILLNAGDGTFQPKVDYVVGGEPYSVAVGDFNGDAKPDLAVADSISNNVSVLLGQGDGTFQAAVNYPTENFPFSIAIGDFNGDGKQDLAVSTSFGVDVLLGNGNGVFQTPGTNVDPEAGGAVTVGDFDGDGRLDLALIGPNDQVIILLGRGDGTFSPGTGFGTGNGPSAAVVGDFNGDGKPDLATANLGSNTVSILKGNGDGTFVARLVFKIQVGVGPGPLAPLAIGDLNGDGKFDLVEPFFSCVSHCPGDSAAVLLGNGDGTFQPAVNYFLGGGSNPVAVALEDFNHDGFLDMVAANAFSNVVGVLLGNGDGTFQTAVTYTVGGGPQSLGVADFNGDGNSDLAVANSDDNTVSILLGNGNGTFQPAINHAFSTSPEAVKAGDFDGDGKVDLAVATACTNINQCTDGSVIVLPGNGDGTFGTPVVYLQGATPVSLAVGDINKDGKLDLVAAIPCADFMCSTGTINVLLGKGDGTFQTPLSQVVASGVKSPVLADLNGDGTLDLMVLDGINFAALLPGNGDGTFQSPQYYSAGADLGSVAVADFNGDGKPDAVTAGGVLLNIGTPDFSLYAPSVTPNPLPSGQSAKGTVTIGSDNGFTGSISLTCSVQPATAQTPTCSLSPTLAQVSTGQSIDSTLTISTSSSRGSLTAPAAPPGAWQRYLIGLPVGGLALIGMGILPRRSKKNRIRAIALASMIFSGLTFQMACGGDTSQSVTITAPVSYTITINGSSGSTQHATTLSITVQ